MIYDMQQIFKSKGKNQDLLMEKMSNDHYDFLLKPAMNLEIELKKHNRPYERKKIFLHQTSRDTLGNWVHKDIFVGISIIWQTYSRFGDPTYLFDRMAGSPCGGEIIDIIG